MRGTRRSSASLSEISRNAFAPGASHGDETIPRTTRTAGRGPDACDGTAQTVLSFPFAPATDE